MTGEIGRFSVGGLNVQTDDLGSLGVEATNFTVVRVKSDVLRRSRIGGIFTRRSVSTVGEGSNETYGVDAAFSLYDNVDFSAYWSRTHTPGLKAEDVSYEAQFSYNPDRYGFQVSHLLVGENFNPEVGFLRRDDFRRTFASAYFSPRPASIQAVRQFTWRANFNYIENGAGIVETREAQASFNTEFETSDAFSVDVASAYELLELPFEIHADVTIPPGRYEFADVTLGYTLGGQRRANGRLTVQFGQFFDGDLKALGFSSGRIEVLPQFFSGARRICQPGRAPAGLLHHHGSPNPGQLQLHTPHVRQRAVPVQLRRRNVEHESAPPVGVQSWQRALRRLYRRAHNGGATLSRAREPRLRGQVQPSASLLKGPRKFEWSPYFVRCRLWG